MKKSETIDTLSKILSVPSYQIINGKNQLNDI